MRKTSFFAAFFGVMPDGLQPGDQSGQHLDTHNYYKIERYIPMRDGVKLFTSIYIPKDTTRQHPIMLSGALILRTLW